MLNGWAVAVDAAARPTRAIGTERRMEIPLFLAERALARGHHQLTARGACGEPPTPSKAFHARCARDHGHPAAYLFRKQAKSRTFRIGGVVELSQLAYVSPAAYLLRKQAKSRTFRTGGVVELSQLA